MTGNPAVEAMEEVIRYTRAMERTRAAISAALPLVQAIGDLQEIEADLSPEIGAALDHANEAAAALSRAAAFVDARVEARLADIRRRQGSG